MRYQDTPPMSPTNDNIHNKDERTKLFHHNLYCIAMNLYIIQACIMHHTFKDTAIQNIINKSRE